MSRIPLGVALLAGATLALGVLGPASARTQLGSKYGGTLVVGGGSEPGILDPTVSPGGALNIFETMCEQLYAVERNHGRVERLPQLAASLPTISKNKLSYTVKLRQGVRFNDGTPFNATAVAASVERFMTYPGSTRASGYDSVESVTASGPYTVVFHLKARDSAFSGNPYVLSPTAVAKGSDEFARNPVCVGPFMFDHRVVGDNVTLVKSPYYYDQKNVYLDKVVFKPTSGAAAAAALKAGDIQVLSGVSPSELPGIERDPSLGVLKAPNLGWRGIIINIGNKNGSTNPYANVGTALAASPKLRQAFEEAIDRKTLNRVVYDGVHETTCTTVPPANSAWYDLIKIPCTPYDPKHAKRLVAESGIPNPTVRLLTSNGTDALRQAQFIQAQEAAVGINVVIDSTDNVTRLARAQSGTFDAYIDGGLEPGGPDPSSLLNSFFTTSGSRNYSGYSNPRMDYVLNNALRATEPKARAVGYRVAQQIISSDRPAIILYNSTTLVGYSAKLTGVKLLGNGALSVAYAQYR